MAEITTHKGDITDMEVDAIVNAANNQLWMGAGVAGAIKSKGGQEIETEAVKKGPIAVGEAVETKAGKLKAKYVIHAAVMGPDLRTDSVLIRTATKNSLRLANLLGVKSIAFPALGTGVGRFPMDEAARVMLYAAKEELAKEPKVQKIIFVLRSEDAYNTFAEELKKISAPAC